MASLLSLDENSLEKRDSTHSFTNLTPASVHLRASRDSDASDRSGQSLNPEIAVSASGLSLAGESFIGGHSQLESCSSTKILGGIYLPSSEVTVVKSTLFNLLYFVLDIKEFLVQDVPAIDEFSPAPDGFSWEACRDKPVLEKLNGKDSVKFATVPVLVHILATSGLSTDHEFLTDFLRTYRYFASSVDVSRLLIMIYIRSDEIAQEKIHDGEKEVSMMGAADISSLVKMRVLNLFKKWIQDQKQDFEEDTLLSGILTTFLSAEVSTDPKTAPYATKMIEQLMEISSSSPKSQGIIIHFIKSSP
jgi:hypothetical protein